MLPTAAEPRFGLPKGLTAIARTRPSPLWKQKVKDFEKAHQSMNREFGDFYDVLVAEGVFEAAPHAAPRLKAIADRFLALASAAPKEGGGSQSASDDGNSLPGQRARKDTAASSSWSGEMHGSPALSPTAPSMQMPASLAYEVVTQPTPDSASFPLYGSMEPASHQFTTPPPSSPPYSALPPPSSLAAHEVTFGRRLQRANTEAGLRLITMPNLPPQLYASVFGFCLFFESREAIISRLTASLNRTRLESLSYLRAPFTSLGGAGTFFLDGKSADGSYKGSLPIGNQGTREYGKQQEMTGFSMGPFSAQVEAMRDERLDEGLRMLLPGFEGDFFDADEVETYLRWLGITIPQSVDFVEAEINVSDLDDSSPLGPMVHAGEQDAFAKSELPSSDFGYGSISGPAGGSGWPGSSPEAEDAMVAPVAAEGVPTEAMALMPSAGAPVLNGELSAFMCAPDPGGMWAAAANWSRTRISINVNALVDEMVHRSVCLGRAPGVRRKDVNRAVKITAGLAPAQ